jgi:hypothetical protein
VSSSSPYSRTLSVYIPPVAQYYIIIINEY